MLISLWNLLKRSLTAFSYILHLDIIILLIIFSLFTPSCITWIPVFIFWIVLPFLSLFVKVKVFFLFVLDLLFLLNTFRQDIFLILINIRLGWITSLFIFKFQTFFILIANLQPIFHLCFQVFNFFNHFLLLSLVLYHLFNNCQFFYFVIKF